MWPVCGFRRVPVSVVFGAYQVADFFTDNDDLRVELDQPDELSILQTPSGTFAYVSGRSEGLTELGFQDHVNVFRVGSDGTLTFLQGVSPLDSNFAPDVDQLELVTVGTRSFLYVNQIQPAFDSFSILTYEIGEDGRMTYLRETEASPEVPFFGAEGMASFTMGGETFLYARGAVSPFFTIFVQTLNIFRAGADGGLDPVSWSETGFSTESSVGVTVGGNTYLIENGGSLLAGSVLLVHRVFSDGTTAVVERVETSIDPLIGNAFEMNVATVGANTFLVTTSFHPERTALNVMTLDAAGQLTSVVQPQIVQDRLLGASPAATVLSFGGETFITVINPVYDFSNFGSYQPMLLLYRLTEAGLLEPVSELVLPDGWDPASMRFAMIDGQPVLIASNSGIPERVETFLLGGGDDTLTGEAGDDHIFGFAGDDVLSGLDGNDTLEGGAGNDTLAGDGGFNALYGGDGDDLVAVAVSSGFAFPVPVADGGAGIDTLDISQTGRMAMVNLSNGSTSSSVLLDGTSIVFLNGPMSATGFENVIGGAAAERFLGSNATNHLTGAGGNDTLHGVGGDDVIDGGGGNDVIDGGLGNDVMRGGDGNDIYVVDAAGDLVQEAALVAGAPATGGVDSVHSAVTTNLNAHLGVRAVENLVLTGTQNINGVGNGLANLMIGNAGNNVLNGGLGNDVMRGGEGSDTFVFNTALGATNVDRINDFNVMEDIVWLEDAVFVGLLSGGLMSGRLASTAFAANPGGSATDAQDRIIYETDTGRLSFDADGSGAGAQVHFATLSPNLILTSEDVFVF
ncbi:MAG: hypothetical protein B7X55_02395 [Rhodobacterales bacterium 34-62-10]|nr:MAG: hypothetical protein B7X55_02395 [Rhodobacterales bacterium 34-62-10]